jgi:hypothetical protein
VTCCYLSSMKYLLLPFLLAATAAQAQMQAPPPSQAELRAQQQAKEAALAPAGTIDALDVKNGFRQYKFGTLPSLYPSLKERGKGTFVAPEEPLAIGDVRIGGLAFSTYSGLLSGISFFTMGAENCTKLLAVLVAQYGQPQDVAYNQKAWQGNVVTLFYSKRETIGAYGVVTSSAVVVMRSNATLP